MQIIVTQRESTARRYVVVSEDLDLFQGIEDGPYVRGSLQGYFGAQWVRSNNRADEAYRTLSMSDIIRVNRVPDGTVKGAS